MVPLESTNSRLYVAGEPAASRSEAVMALTYGSKGAVDAREALGCGAAARVAVAAGPPPSAEQPAQASTAAQVRPTADFRKSPIRTHRSHVARFEGT